MLTPHLPCPPPYTTIFTNSLPHTLATSTHRNTNPDVGRRCGDQAAADEDQEAADEQAEASAFVPFEANGHLPPGEALQVLPCPPRVPQELEVGQPVARWFGEGYNAWFVGKIVMVNKRKTKTDNVTAEFYYEDEGTTWGHWCASADNYGANRKWVLLKVIPTVDVEGGADEPVPAAFNTPGAGPS